MRTDRRSARRPRRQATSRQGTVPVKSFVPAVEVEKDRDIRVIVLTPTGTKVIYK